MKFKTKLIKLKVKRGVLLFFWTYSISTHRSAFSYDTIDILGEIIINYNVKDSYIKMMNDRNWQ